MAETLLYVTAALSGLTLVLTAMLLLKGRPAESGALEARLDRVEAGIRDEGERVRRQASTDSSDLRKELTSLISQLGEGLGSTQSRSQEALASAVRVSLSEAAAKSEGLRVSVEQRLEAISGLTQGASQKLAEDLGNFRNALLENLMKFSTDQNRRFEEAGQKDGERGQLLRKELLTLHESLSGTLLQRVSQLNSDITVAWQNFGQQLVSLKEEQAKAMEQLRLSVETSLTNIRQDNETRLERMRQTVDEKLQSTLETRLGESFKLVSERLENVQRGLGEMQTLAAGVGDLKKVMTGVKTRGTWGEVLLGSLLEQVLTPEQYATNVATTGRGEKVEFAIRLPGRGEGEQGVWLPIDSKFPKEDYERLLTAQDAGDAEQALSAGSALEQSIRKFAQDICDKYIESPKTTDFGIMFLPSEGLYAEVIRRTETVEYLQRKCRVLVTGPTTLAALLNSLQMGFRTLAIEKRSSEVWELLGAVKTEFGKYADVMAKVQKKLQEASNTIDSAEVRTRAINRKLKNVEQLEDTRSAEVFPSRLLEDELTEAADERS